MPTATVTATSSDGRWFGFDGPVTGFSPGDVVLLKSDEGARQPGQVVDGEGGLVVPGSSPSAPW